MLKVGYKMSEASKKKMRDAKLRNPVKYWLGKDRLDMKGNQWNTGKPSWNKGKNWSKAFKKKVSISVKQLWATPEYRKRMVAIHNARKKGKMGLHYNWKGGKSFEPYTVEFTKQLKKVIRTRDNFQCQQCYKLEKDCPKALDIHHIDYNKENCKSNNLITLCRVCNIKANYGKREDWTKYYNNKLIIAAAETNRSNT